MLVRALLIEQLNWFVYSLKYKDREKIKKQITRTAEKSIEYIFFNDHVTTIFRASFNSLSSRVVWRKHICAGVEDYFKIYFKSTEGVGDAWCAFILLNDVCRVSSLS